MSQRGTIYIVEVIDPASGEVCVHDRIFDEKESAERAANNIRMNNYPAPARVVAYRRVLAARKEHGDEDR